MSAPELWLVHLGAVPYADALAFQRDVAHARIEGRIPQDVLLLLEHPPVVTLGRTAKAAHLLSSPDLLRARGVELFEVERGGDVTFHGPGQLVGYPIVDLKRHTRDLHWYLRQMEEALIRAMDVYAIVAERNPGFTGVWTRGRKLASIGVHARDWVTWHGFALNVTVDLAYFGLMVPCGIEGVIMTSMARELNDDHIAMDDVTNTVARAFANVFDLVPRVVGADALPVPPPPSIATVRTPS